MNLITPGREEDDIESKLFTRKDYNAAKNSNLSEIIVKGLGGINNISDIGCCATRLRLTVKDSRFVYPSIFIRKRDSYHHDDNNESDNFKIDNTIFTVIFYNKDMEPVATFENLKVKDEKGQLYLNHSISGK